MKTWGEMFRELLVEPRCTSECTGRCRGCEDFDFRYARVPRSALREALEEFNTLSDMVRGLERGCDCEYDHRCKNCDTIVQIKRLVD